MVKSLLLIARDKNSSSEFDCSYASSVLNKIRNPLTVCGIHLHLRNPLTFYGIHVQLRNPEQLAIFACCGIRNKTNEPTKFTLEVYVCGIHWNFVSGIHLHFGTYFKKPGTYRHKIVLLSSANEQSEKRNFIYEKEGKLGSNNSVKNQNKKIQYNPIFSNSVSFIQGSFIEEILDSKKFEAFNFFRKYLVVLWFSWYHGHFSECVETIFVRRSQNLWQRSKN